MDALVAAALVAVVVLFLNFLLLRESRLTDLFQIQNSERIEQM